MLLPHPPSFFCGLVDGGATAGAAAASQEASAVADKSSSAREKRGIACARSRALSGKDAARFRGLETARRLMTFPRLCERAFTIVLACLFGGESLLAFHLPFLCA